MFRNRTIMVVFFLLSFLSGKAERGRFRLFSEEVKTAYPSAVYDFLETYLYRLDSLYRKGVQEHPSMMRDKILFLKGESSVVHQINPKTDFTLTRMEDKMFNAVWKDSTGVVLLDMVFPASYELILGASKNKIERTMEKQLKAMPLSFTPDSLVDMEVKMLADSVFQSQPVTIYEIESISDATYYSRLDSTMLQPIFDSNQKWYSSVNLMQGLIADIDDYQLYIEQSVYEFDTLKYTISLSQWLNYCRDMRASVYIGLEEEREDGLMILLLAQSNDLGFKHMLSMILPWNFVEKRNAILKAKLYAYIPTHNVKTYYQERDRKEIEK